MYSKLLVCLLQVFEMATMLLNTAVNPFWKHKMTVSRTSRSMREITPRITC